tara:strand:+ start:340 stop:1149 length:810 start_codon:yes stop_codon:yes gene_type:complete
MGYIGPAPTTSFQSFVKQDITTSATANYTLSQSVTNANELRVVLNNVIQEPTTAYTASGTSLTMASALTSSDDLYVVYMGKAVGTVNPASGSVGTSELSATGTKDATTFLRGDNSFVAPSFGKILQVVQTAKTDTFSTTSTSYTDVTGLSVAITPSSTSSKVLVTVSSNSSVSSGNNAEMKLVRGSTDIFIGDDDSTHSRASAQTRVNDNNGCMTLTFSFLDTPNTTSETTYKVQYNVQGGTGTINKAQADGSSIARTASSIIAMEVGA